MASAKRVVLSCSQVWVLAIATGLPVYSQSPAAYAAAKTGGLYMHNYYLPPITSTPFWPAWSPDGTEIAFSMQGSIWKVRVGDTVAHELTSNPTYDSSPAWSPDGKWIVYTAEEDSHNINLRILKLSTGETWALTTGNEIHVDPAWSPDGTRIAYVSTYPDGWFNIFVMPIADGKPGKPIQLTAPNDYGKDRLYFGRIDLHIEPTWSPDGKEIIFLSNRGIPLGSGALWRMPAELHGISKARLIHREETLYTTRPDWSPDGSRIVYSSYLGDQFSNLFVLPVGGGEPYKMTFGDWDHFQPRWSPDGQRIAYISNQYGLSDIRILEAFGGRETQVKIREKRFKRPTGWLEFHVNDGETGKPTEARIYIRASDGKTYTPDDVPHRVGRSGEHLFHARGTFLIQVPSGLTAVEAVKGFEHQPASSEVYIRPNEVSSVTLNLPRISHLAAKGWYGGSTHVHMNYGGLLHSSPETLMFMAAAEDLSIISALVANKDNRILDYQYFRGALDPHSTTDRLLYFNEEYRPPLYGHISLLNLKDHLISPFTTGYEGTAIESLYPSNTDIFRLARAEGAIGGYVHPFDSEPTEAGYARARAFPVDVALGTVDYLEMLSAADAMSTSHVWHRILNCGFKLPAVGGEDSETNLPRMPLFAADRTYAYLGPNLDWNAWIDAIRRGATFVTNGPLLDFTIDGRKPGEQIRLPAGGGRVKVFADMKCIAPVEKFEILNNGEVNLNIALLEGGRSASTTQEIEVRHSGWYTMRAYSSHRVHPLDDTYPYAETSPIYVYCGLQLIRSADDANYFMTWIDTVSKMVAGDPGWHSEKEREHVLSQFQEARRIFEQRAQDARR